MTRTQNKPKQPKKNLQTNPNKNHLEGPKVLKGLQIEDLKQGTLEDQKELDLKKTKI